MEEFLTNFVKDIVFYSFIESFIMIFTAFKVCKINFKTIDIIPLALISSVLVNINYIILPSIVFQFTTLIIMSLLISILYKRNVIVIGVSTIVSYLTLMICNVNINLLFSFILGYNVIKAPFAVFMASQYLSYIILCIVLYYGYRFMEKNMKFSVGTITGR